MINKNKQKGATFITWISIITVVLLIFSALIKIGPSYLEYNSVCSMMDSIAAEPGIKDKSKRYIYGQVRKYMNINGMYTLEKLM